MKLTKLLSEYKSTAQAMKKAAQKYNYLQSAVSTRKVSATEWAEYKSTWRELLALNNRAYNIMYEYRSLCGTVSYKILFALGMIKKQHSFIYTDSKKVCFKSTQLISLVNLK